METLQIHFADGTTGRLACEEAGVVTCQHDSDGSFCDDPANAGTLYLLLHEGQEDPWQVEAARTVGYVVEVQRGESLVLPEPEAAPEPEPPTRRRSSS